MPPVDSLREPARTFFERNFRPLRITKLGDSAGFLTGYYEPIADGSRFPTGIFNVPIYRRPPDLVLPLTAPVPAFPTGDGRYGGRRAENWYPTMIVARSSTAPFDGQHIGRICWIKDQTDAMFILISGVGTRAPRRRNIMLRIKYDAHNGYPFVPVGRILVERNRHLA